MSWKRGSGQTEAHTPLEPFASVLYSQRNCGSTGCEHLYFASSFSIRCHSSRRSGVDKAACSLLRKNMMLTWAAVRPVSVDSQESRRGNGRRSSCDSCCCSFLSDCRSGPRCSLPATTTHYLPPHFLTRSSTCCHFSSSSCNHSSQNQHSGIGNGVKKEILSKCNRRSGDRATTMRIAASGTFGWDGSRNK